MLTFAMVLEEIQRTLYLQADAKVEKGEMEGPRAETEAKRACERIDERFGMLVGLFQCKFRDRRWGSSGSFGNQTPEIRGRSGHEFCRGVLGLVREKGLFFHTFRFMFFFPLSLGFFTLGSPFLLILVVVCRIPSREPKGCAAGGRVPVSVHFAVGGEVSAAVSRIAGVRRVALYREVFTSIHWTMKFDDFMTVTSRTSSGVGYLMEGWSEYGRRLTVCSFCEMSV